MWLNILSRTVGPAPTLVSINVLRAATFQSFSLLGIPIITAELLCKRRIRTLLKALGSPLPKAAVTVNLLCEAPLTEHRHFDLAMLLGLICLIKETRPPLWLQRYEFFGALNERGTLLPAADLDTAVAAALEAGHTVVVPQSELKRLDFTDHPKVFGARHVCEVFEHLQLKLPNAARA
jgi:magnesium chelatase family protein